jgi:alkaline phosphatase D
VRGLAVLAVVAVSLAVGVSASAKQGRPGFPLGVAAGEVTPTSTRLWARAPKVGAVTLEVLPPTAGTRASPIRTYALRAEAAHDLTVQRTVTGLRPGTRYRYRFHQGPVTSATGTFTAAPRATASVGVRFAITGDADATPGPNGRPGFNGFETYAAMARERNDFNVNFGDTIYSDSELAGAAVARSVPEKWAKYRLGLGLAPLRQLRAAAGLYSGWDDHEFINDFSGEEHGAAIYRDGVRAFLDYTPAAYTARTGLYRTFRWGRHLQLFFLDARSFRSAKATAACAGDIAPTAPQAVRQAFAALSPGLAKPVPQECLDAIASPARTLLGQAQLDRFRGALRASTATFKVVVNPVPLMQLYALPYDRWEGYAADRARMLAALAGVRNVVVLTTDTHAHLIGEIRSQTFAPSGPVGTGIWEVVTGPVATNTYAKEIDDFLGSPGFGAVVTGAFFKPAPPNGLGLRCAQTDTYGYAQVTVTATTLRVAPKSSTGAPVRDVTGGPCAPLVVRAT